MTKRNFYISYLKGVAILGVILIHLIDWSNIELSQGQKIAKEFLYPSVLFFIALVGTVVYVAYHKKEPQQYMPRLVIRGLQLIGIYFLYNLVKLVVFDFSKEPFYQQFSEKSILDWQHVLGLQVFTVPITIIFTIGIYLLISPLLLYLVQKIKFPQTFLLLLTLGVFGLNYFSAVPSQSWAGFLYSQGYVMFPISLWFVPYLIGFLLAMAGFEKHKNVLLILFAILTAGTLWQTMNAGKEWFFSWHMYPLEPYYIFASLFLLYVLIYIFQLLEKIHSKNMAFFLAVLRVLGDFTLSLYILHWVVVDITLWLFAPYYFVIWIAVAALLGLFIWWRRTTLLEYQKEHWAFF